MVVVLLLKLHLLMRPMRLLRVEAGLYCMLRYCVHWLGVVDHLSMLLSW